MRMLLSIDPIPQAFVESLAVASVESLTVARVERWRNPPY
jgi:hypothetical protein